MLVARPGKEEAVNLEEICALDHRTLRRHREGALEGSDVRQNALRRQITAVIGERGFGKASVREHEAFNTRGCDG